MVTFQSNSGATPAILESCCPKCFEIIVYDNILGETVLDVFVRTYDEALEAHSLFVKAFSKISGCV